MKNRNGARGLLVAAAFLLVGCAQSSPVSDGRLIESEISRMQAPGNKAIGGSAGQRQVSVVIDELATEAFGRHLEELNSEASRSRGHRVVGFEDVDDEKERLRLSFTPYFWAAGVDGKTGVGTLRDVKVDISPFEFVETVVDNFSFATLGRLQADHGKWSFDLDFIYLGLEFDGDIGPIDVDVDYTQIAVQLLVGYRFLETPLGEGDEEFTPTLSLALLGGARYQSISADFDFSPGPSTGPDADFIDPVVGLETSAQLTPELALDLAGDYGGFGVGSEQTWSFRTGLRYALSSCFELSGGWIILDTDYDEGTSPGDFRYDVRLSGPYLGGVIRF